jgi:hypothetical protein
MMIEPYSIPIQQLTTEQLKLYHDRHSTVDSEYFNLELIAAIRQELKEREITEKLRGETPKEDYRAKALVYLVMAILAVICGLQLRLIFQSVKCPLQHILTEKSNVN